MTYVRRYLPILLAILATFGITVAVTTDDDGSHKVVVHVPRKIAPAPPGDLNLKAPLDQGGTAPATIQENVHNQRGLLPKRPAAGAQTISCQTLYDGGIWSSRGGVRPTEFVLHYTAGNGTAESIDAYFRRTRAASATYLLEPSGHCRQEVPESQKPWTQLAANPYAISVEIVTTGWNISRDQWLAMPIFRNGYLASLMRDSMGRWGIPIRRVDPVGCNFIPGYTDHNALECGNDHTDVLPNFPWDVLADQLSGPTYIVTKAAKHMCSVYNQYTTRLEDKGHLDPYGQDRRERAERYFIRNHNHGHTNFDCYRGPPPHGHVRVRVIS